MLGGVLAAAVVAVSLSAFVFQGRDDQPEVSAPKRTTTSTAHRTTTTSSTATPTTTSTTPTTTPATTTTAAPPPPTEAPAPAPVPAAGVPPSPAPAPACDGSGSAVIDAMNGDRAANGLGALCGNGQLAGFAQSWANWMAQNQTLTHQDLGGILAGTAFNSVAENILDGPGGMSAGQMESAWMQSPSHRENILNGGYRAAGVGIAYSSDGRIWVVVDFGG